MRTQTRTISNANLQVNGLGELVTGNVSIDVKLVPVWFTADVDMALSKKAT